jgi:putative oxidoreductase
LFAREKQVLRYVWRENAPHSAQDDNSFSIEICRELQTQDIRKEIMQSLAAAYEALCVVLDSLRNPLLLAIRLYWGWQFATDGWGKLTHLDRVAEYFGSLNLPAPGATALMVGVVELAGGILFAAGIGSRLVSLVLFVNMTAAYLAAPDDRVNFFHVFSKPEDFYGAGPYTYWFAALLILILGPGLFAIDTLISRRYEQTQAA